MSVQCNSANAALASALLSGCRVKCVHCLGTSIWSIEDARLQDLPVPDDAF